MVGLPRLAAHFLLDDLARHQLCAAADRVVVTSQLGSYPHDDDGVEVRRLGHALRSRAIENVNGQFKGIFDCLRPVPTRGLVATSRHVLGAVFVYNNNYD